MNLQREVCFWFVNIQTKQRKQIPQNIILQLLGAATIEMIY